MIGIICSDMYRKGISVNFLDIFGFASCPSEDNLLSKQYVFMEKGGLSVRSFIKKQKIKNNDPIGDSILVQILHSIGVYQHYHKIQHNDLHLGNVLVETISPDTMYNGQKLYDADWFHYQVHGTNIYLPKSEIIIKIIDYDCAVKYSTPLIGPQRSLERGQASSVREKPWIPNWYCESSDPIYSTDHLYDFFHGNKFVRNILGWMLGSNGKNTSDRWIEKEIMKNFTAGGKRPSLKMLSGKYSRATPVNILTNRKLMAKYLKVPTSGNVVTLGVIL